MGRKLGNSAELYDSAVSDDLGETEGWFDEEPVPTRRSQGARPAAVNHRRAIEELQEQRLLRSMLKDDLSAEFPEL
ncbi:MAG: hypothetical protein JJU06_02860 [Ectothiorhodospiraceae bacterium]|nr:hypothetical protein [Ectothiorhodospiraceae bacterium]MCH8505149.1 hypothetical protein [Ectothiorhodospiraceae bacterium]